MRGPDGGQRGIRAGQEVVQHVVGIAGGPEPRPDLVFRQPGFQQLLPELLHEARLVAQKLLRLLRRGELLAGSYLGRDLCE